MVEQVALELKGPWAGARGAVFRYELVGRLRRTCERRGVVLLAFGFGEDQLRFAAEGPEADLREVVRGLKVGTIRAAARWGLALTAGPHVRFGARSAEEAVIWAHRAAEVDPSLGPLSTPWTSHRDLLGYRRAPFFDPGPALSRVDPERVHAACGGRGRPLLVRTATLAAPSPGLPVLLRAAAAVLGVLPADRRCFRPFVHAARRFGFRTAELARALALTPRRVRQLGAEEAPELGLVLSTLRDPALSRLP